MNTVFSSFRSSLFAGASLVALMTASPALSDAGSCPDTLRYADTGVEGLEELRRSFGPFVEVMEGITGLNIEFFPVGNRTAAVTALQFEQVDVIMTGPSEYVAIQSRIDEVKPIVSFARPAYASIFIVREDAGIESLQDLKGKRISMKDVGSTTGHIIPAYMLVQAGIDIDRDVTIYNLGGTLFQALISGDVDATATGVRDWDSFVAMAGDGYKILEESPQMPDDLILAGSHISTECVNFLRGVMMEHGDALIDATLAPEGRERYRGAALVSVDDATYDVVREAYAALDLIPE